MTRSLRCVLQISRSMSSSWGIIGNRSSSILMIKDAIEQALDRRVRPGKAGKSWQTPGLALDNLFLTYDGSSHVQTSER